jgi:hypothetical protein
LKSTITNLDASARLECPTITLFGLRYTTFSPFETLNMERRLEPLSTNDLSLIRKQLTIAYFLIGGVSVFICFVIYFMFDKSALSALIGATLCVGLFFFARHKIIEKINPILQDNRKLIFSNAEITAKDVEMEMKTRTRRDSSTMYHYMIYLGEEKIELGQKEYDLYEAGTKVNVEVTNVSRFFLRIGRA